MEDDAEENSNEHEVDADDDDAMDDDGAGWGKPRPTIEDMLPSTPDHSDDDAFAADVTVKVSDRVSRLPEASSIDFELTERKRVVPLIDFPLTGCDGVPRMELHQVYQKHQVDTATKHHFTTWTNGEKDPWKRFTSVFTCPLTGEHFACGLWGNNDVETIDDVSWYRTKKIAMNAAAARALDCFSLRRCQNIGMRPYQRCEDPPYSSANDAPKLPDLPYGIELPTCVNHEEEMEEGDKLANNTTAKPPAKMAIHQLYQHMRPNGIVPQPASMYVLTKANYSSWSNWAKSPNSRFTAIFICPFTGERFASGKLIGEEGSYEDDYWLFDRGENRLVPREKETIEEGNFYNNEREENEERENNKELTWQKIHFNWYRTKKQAETAAAGRALDCIMYRQESLCDTTTSDRQYCEEDPYTTDNVPERWKLVSESVNTVQDVVHGKGGISKVQVAWGSVPHQHRVTADVVDHESSWNNFVQDQDQWRSRYKEARLAGSSDINQEMVQEMDWAAGYST